MTEKSSRKSIRS